MKKLFVFLAALVGLSVISCNKEANITVEPSQLTFSAQGGENVLNVTGGTGITATSGDESWCHVAVAATRITVTVDPNEGEESRNTTVTVSCRGTNVPVPVSQEGLSASTDIPSEVEVPYGGGTVTLGKVTANVEVKVTIPTQVTWIHDPAVAEDGTVTVVADANTGAESREAVINVYPVGDVKLVQDVAAYSIELGNVNHDAENGYVPVDITIMMRGEEAAGYKFIVFEDGAFTTTDEIMSALNAQGYTREDVDMYGSLGQQGEPDTLTMNLEVNKTFHATGVALDANGTQSALVDHVFTTTQDSPINIYNSWLGDWRIEIYNYDADLWGQDPAYIESRVAASDTVSIVANNPGFTYWFMGWENISYGTEDPNVNGYVMMNAGFSLSDYSMSTMGGPCEPALQLSTGEQVRLLPIIPAEYTWDGSAESYSVSFYMLNYASLATTVTEYWGEGNPEGLNMSPVGITDSQTQQQVIGDGISLVFVDANTLDYDQPTVLGFGTGMSQMWLYPYTLTKISDDPSMTPLSSSVAATRFYGRLDAVKGVSSNQKFYVNSGVSASNGPVKFARMR